VFTEAAGAGYVDIFLVLDVSASSLQPAGADFTQLFRLPNFRVDRTRFGLPIPCAGANRRGRLVLTESILAAEIVASLRLLSQQSSDDQSWRDNIW
jgi:hypothetical protein